MNTVNVFDQLANIAQFVRKCPTITLSRAYVRAYRDFCSQTEWLTVQITGVITPGVPEYSMGSDPYVEIIGIKGMQGSILNGDGSYQYWPIYPGNPAGFDPNYQPTLSGQYAYVPQAQFVLFPTPGPQLFNVLTSAIVTPKDGATQLPSAPLSAYSNEIEAGALAYLFDIPGMPWSSPVMAAKYGRIFSAGISNAKSQVQRNFNTGSQRALPRTFTR